MTNVEALYQKTRELTRDEKIQLIRELITDIGESTFVEQLFAWDADKNTFSAEMQRMLRCYRHMEDEFRQQIIEHYGDYVQLDHEHYEQYFEYLEYLEYLRRL